MRRRCRFGPFRFAVGTGPGVWRPVLPAFASDQTAWLKDVTPFLLESIVELTGGESLEVNLRIAENNIRLAAEIATAWSQL